MASIVSTKLVTAVQMVLKMVGYYGRTKGTRTGTYRLVYEFRPMLGRDFTDPPIFYYRQFSFTYQYI